MAGQSLHGPAQDGDRWLSTIDSGGGIPRSTAVLRWESATADGGKDPEIELEVPNADGSLSA